METKIRFLNRLLGAKSFRQALVIPLSSIVWSSHRRSNDHYCDHRGGGVTLGVAVGVGVVVGAGVNVGIGVGNTIGMIDMGRMDCVLLAI
jgi:hypothetical protein